MAVTSSRSARWTVADRFRTTNMRAYALNAWRRRTYLEVIEEGAPLVFQNLIKYPVGLVTGTERTA